MPAKDAQPAAQVAGLECSDLQWRSLTPGDRIEGRTTSTSTGSEQQHSKARNPCALAEQSDETSAYASASSSHGQNEHFPQVLSCTLIWMECPTADIYHIFYQSRKVSATSVSDCSPWAYLGSTGLSTFRAVDMRLLGKDDAISIAVSASSSMACWDLDNWTTILVSAMWLGQRHIL